MPQQFPAFNFLIGRLPLFSGRAVYFSTALQAELDTPSVHAIGVCNLGWMEMVFY